MRLQLFARLTTHLAHFYTTFLFFFSNVKSAQQFLSLLIKFAAFCTIFLTAQSLVIFYPMTSILSSLSKRQSCVSWSISGVYLLCGL